MLSLLALPVTLAVEEDVGVTLTRLVSTGVTSIPPALPLPPVSGVGKDASPSRRE